MSGLLRALCAPPAVRCLRLLPPPLTPDDEPAFLEAAQQLLTLTLTRTRTRTRTITITLNLTQTQTLALALTLTLTLTLPLPRTLPLTLTRTLTLTRRRSSCCARPSSPRPPRRPACLGLGLGYD